MKDYHPEGTLINAEENKKFMQCMSNLQLAYTSKTILEAIVTMCDCDHNLIVDLGIMRGLIPREEGAIGITEGTTRDIALISRVGKAVSFVITEICEDENGKKYALLSRKAAQIKCLEYILNEKKIGDIIEARVTHLESFGAFCDIGCGNIALLPIDSISISRITHPKDRFVAGDIIKVIIKSIDSNNKITLSHKELLGSWTQNVNSFCQGETVSGIVRSIEEYGIFVELAPNLAGLAEPKKDVYVGQTVSVFIKSIIPEKMKIKLIVIDTLDVKLNKDYKYFYNGEHIKEFIYSPTNSFKQISTYF